MITATENIVSLLNNPTTEAVSQLFCEVSTRKALDVSSPEEWAIATNRQDQDWIDARNAEYEARRLALLAHIQGDRISRETADKIDDWAIANPYIRPVNSELIAQAKLELEYAIAQRSAAFADRWVYSVMPRPAFPDNPHCLTCDRILHSKGHDRHGDRYYCCPNGCSQRTKPTRAPKYHCNKCGKPLQKNKVIGEQIYFRPHKCLPSDGLSDL